MPSVFLSHSSKDKFFARKLAETLASSGVEVWIDEAELSVGDSLLEKVAGAIERADFVAVVLSHNSVRSNWVKKELHLAMTGEVAGHRIKVLPVLIDRCEIPDFLKDKVYADFTNEDDFDRPLARVLHALGVEQPTASAPKADEVEKAQPRQEPAPTGRSLEGFDDIRITGIDKDRAYRPDPQMHLFNVYMEMSAHPPQEWVQIFEAERSFPRHTMWRRAWVEGNFIVVYCAPEEIKKYHLRDLKDDVGNTNQKYREHLQRIAAQQARERDEEKRLLDQLDDAFEDLDLD